MNIEKLFIISANITIIIIDICFIISIIMSINEIIKDKKKGTGTGNGADR